jgi:type I restriction enzyme S subunit
VILDTEIHKQNRRDGSPQTWVWTTAREVCIKIQDGTHFSPKGQVSRGKYPYVTAKNIRPTGLDLSNLTYLQESDHRAIYQRCDPKKGDVLLVKDGVNTGDAAINTLDEEISLLSSVCLLRTHPGILYGDFLRYFLLSPIGAGVLKGKMTGTAIKRIVLAHIKELPVPVAPIAEQQRIVSEIEKQFTRLDVAVKALKRARANLKRYRVSVLKAACEGRLVPTEAELARAEGRDYEPADALLQRILKERRAKWEAAGLSKMKTKLKVPKDDKWRAKYAPANSPAVNSLPALPIGWTWASVEQLASLTPNSITDGPFGSNLKTAHYAEAGPRVIRLKNIGDGVFVDEHAHISSEHFGSLAKHRVHAGDLVIAALGERPPRACIIPTSVGLAIVKADCVRFKPNDELALSAYLNCALNSDGTRTRTAAIVHGVGRPRLNLSEIKSIALPLPPLAEQHRIVAEVERRLSLMEELEALLKANLKRVERLRQSILKRAFEGKLVAQDPNDEPASALLKRIRDEREAQVTDLRSGNRRRTSLKQLRVLPIAAEKRSRYASRKKR